MGRLLNIHVNIRPGANDIKLILSEFTDEEAE
jgi:hypothetical protein